MNAIETNQLSRRFRGEEALAALDLNVRAGSVTALLGPNGAGKSTTIKVLLNLLRPTAGKARVLGVDSQHLGPNEFAQIGYVAESQRLPEWMTVQQFLDYCRPLYPRWDRALEKKFLGEFDLPTGRKLRHLSRGMLMKVSLVSALAYRPQLLILDEPFSGLDPVVREDLGRGIIAATEAQEWTILISSHDIEEVERIADQIVLLDHGRKRVDESVVSLQGRFRRVEVSGTISSLPPAGSWQYQKAENYISYIEPNYRPGTSEREWQRDYGSDAFTAQSMTLRDIFISIAREKSLPEEEAAA